MSIFSFGLGGQFLNQLLIVLLSLSFLFQDCFLLVRTFDHFHANRDLLLVILARSWILSDLLAVVWESSFVVSLRFWDTPVVSWSRLFGRDDTWIISSRAYVISLLNNLLKANFLFWRDLFKFEFSKLPIIGHLVNLRPALLLSSWRSVITHILADSIIVHNELVTVHVCAYSRRHCKMLVSHTWPRLPTLKLILLINRVHWDRLISEIAWSLNLETVELGSIFNNLIVSIL